TDPAEGATRAPIMLSTVDLPQPEGPTSATNSPSRTSRDTPATARTSRAPSTKVFSRSRIAIRTRETVTASRLVLRLRLPDEAHVHRLRVRDGLVERGGDPHLLAAGVVGLVHHEVPVEDGAVVAHRLEHGLAGECLHVGLVKEIHDFVVFGLPDPLLRAVARVHIGLDEVGRLLDRLLEAVAHGDRDAPAENAIPGLLVQDVVDGPPEPLAHRRGLPLRDGHDRVELTALEAAQHGGGGPPAHPLHVVVHGFAVGRLDVLAYVDAVDVRAGADGGRRDHRLAPHELLVAERLHALHALVEEVFAHHYVGVRAAVVGCEQDDGVPTFLRGLEGVIGIAEGEHRLTRRHRLHHTRAAARDDEVRRLDPLLLEE